MAEETFKEQIAEYLFKMVNQFCDEDTEAWKLVTEAVRQHYRAEAWGILPLITKRIKGIENPYEAREQMLSNDYDFIWNEAIQRVLKELEE